MKQTVTLSIKNVPIELVEQLRGQASRHHRSLQGELMAIIEESAYRNSLTPKDVLNLVRASGLKTNQYTGQTRQGHDDVRSGD